jgi:hypothetical protein
MTAANTLRAAAAAAVLLVGALAPGNAGAQTLKLSDGPAQEIDFDRPEAWAMEWTASLTLLTSIGPPRLREAGEVELGLELDWIPSLSEDERRVGFNGTKVEDFNRLDVLPRPARGGSGMGDDAELAYRRPVTIEG